MITDSLLFYVPVVRFLLVGAEDKDLGTMGLSLSFESGYAILAV